MKHQINCLLVDDEPLARELMLSFIQKISFLNPVAICENAFDAAELLQSNPVDLLITDIQMPEAGEYLKQHFPGYSFVTPIRSIEHKDAVYDGEDYYRIFPYVKDSVTFTALQNPALAFEAAKQFG